MKTPYIFRYHSPPLAVNQTRPVWSTLSLRKAQETHHFNFKNAELSSQVANYKPFYVELLEFKNKADFDFYYEITAPQHFLFMILEGTVSFYTADGLYISHAKEGHLALTYNQSGSYKVKMKRGTYRALCITLDATFWQQGPTAGLPVIRQHLEAVARSPPLFAMLPYCVITKDIDHAIETIYSKLSNVKFFINHFLSLQVFAILESYELQASEKLASLPYQVRSFIHDHFSDPHLSSHSIARHFEKVERSLRNQFITEFNISPQGYYTHLRVRTAKRLMEEKGLKPIDIFAEVGYKEVNTLRYHLNKYGN